MGGFNTTMAAGMAPPAPAPPPPPVTSPPPLNPAQAAQYAQLAGAMFAGATTGAKGATPNAAIAQTQPAPPPNVSPPQIPGVTPGAQPTPSDAMFQKLLSDSKSGQTGSMSTPSKPPTGPTAPGAPQPPAAPSTAPETLGDIMARLQKDRTKYDTDSSNAPQYKPPNKWLELATVLAGLAFPAGGLGKFAAGMSGGLAKGAEDAYGRKEEQWKDKQAADEKAMGLDATLYDAQAKIEDKAQQDAIKNDFSRERIAISQGHLDQSAQKLTWHENIEFPANQKRYYDLAAERADVTMRGQDFTTADKQMGTAAQFGLESIRQVGMNMRNSANISERLYATSAVQQAETARAAYAKSVAGYQKSLASDPAKMTAAITAATQTLNDTVNGILAKAPAGSDMANVATLKAGLDADTTQTTTEELNGYASNAAGTDTVSTPGYSPGQGVVPQTAYAANQLSQKGYSTDAATGVMYPPGYQGLSAPIDAGGGGAPGAVPTGGPSGASAPNVGPGAPAMPGGDPPPQASNPAEQHDVNLAQQQGNYQLQLGAMAQQHGVGGGTGIPEDLFKRARELVAGHAANYPTAEAFLAAQKADNPQGVGQLSNSQAGQLVELWAHTRRQQGQPVDLPPPPGQTPPHPTVPGGGPASLDITKPDLGLPGAAKGGPVASSGPETPPGEPPLNKPAFAGLPPQMADVAGNVIHAVQGAIAHKTPTKGEVIRQAAQKTGVPEALLIAIAKNESGFNNDATSPAGAHGMFQLMPGTAKALGVDPNNPVENVMGGATYIGEQLKRFHSIPAAIAAYNAGPQAVIDHRGIPPFPETRAYVSHVLADYRKLLQTYPLQAHDANGTF